MLRHQPNMMSFHQIRLDSPKANLNEIITYFSFGAERWYYQFYRNKGRLPQIRSTALRGPANKIPNGICPLSGTIDMRVV